jgi:2,3-bisphosphoglycerate-dependent phosphoglycerate mutase
MRLLFIRHGQSTNNAAFEAASVPPGLPPDAVAAEEPYADRVPDPALTALGGRQAEALAGALRSGRLPVRPTHLYASLTLRAVQTAWPLAEALGLPVVLHPQAHEVGGLHRREPSGERYAEPGFSVRELQKWCPAAVPRTADGATDPDLDVPWHGGFESLADALPRARGVLAGLRRAHRADDVVALVTHQYFGQFLLADLLGLSGPPWRRFRIDNTAHVAVTADGPHPILDWINRSDHLVLHEVTN